MKWTHWTNMNELKLMNWTEWMKQMNWNERIEINMHWIALKWMNWHDGIDMNDLTYINELKWMNCLKGMNCQKCSVPSVFLFLWFLSEIKLSLHYATVSCTFCRPHRPKVVWDRHFFLRFLCSIELSLQSRAHFVDHFPGSRRETAETETLQRRPQTANGHFTRKKDRFCARECFQPWIRAFPTAHTSQLLDDDVIDMMTWLTWWLRWWCGCHDGETASHWQSSVTRKFPN